MWEVVDMAELEPGEITNVHTTNVDVCLSFMAELEPGDLEYVDDYHGSFAGCWIVVRMLGLEVATTLGRFVACGKW